MMEAAAEAPPRPKPARSAATARPPPSEAGARHNPLDGGGGVAGFRPSGNMRRAGRGG